MTPEPSPRAAPSIDGRMRKRALAGPTTKAGLPPRIFHAMRTARIMDGEQEVDT